jgi:hypothetical protein
MTVDLAGKLEQLGLSQYLEVLVSEGFDSWDTVLDIQESDLYVRVPWPWASLADPNAGTPEGSSLAIEG